MVTKKGRKVRKLTFYKKTQIFLILAFGMSNCTPANSQAIFEGWSRASPLGAKNAAVYGSFYNPTKEKIELSKIDMSVMFLNQPYSKLEPDFPILTDDHFLDYGRKVVFSD